MMMAESSRSALSSFRKMAASRAGGGFDAETNLLSEVGDGGIVLGNQDQMFKIMELEA